MTLIDQYPAGKFCWYELGTSELDGGAQFYKSLFGWGSEDVPMGDGKYVLAKVQGRDVAGMYSLMEEQKKMGVPPHWLLYVKVDDVDASTKAAVDAGATTLMGPMDVMDVGRMTAMKDPGGAVFAMWQPVKHQGSGVLGVEGTWCWSELMTRDAEGAKAFYSKVFGWVPNTLPMGAMPYTLFNLGDKQVGGMLEMTPEMEGIPPNWGIYWKVDNIEASTQKVKDLGGSVMCGVEEAMGVGRFSICRDPQGAVFAMIQLNQ